MSKIKTRDTVRDVKTLDRAANLSQRVKDTATKTKETAESEQPEQESRHTSPTAYATDRITDGGKAAAHKAQGAVRHPVRRVRRSSQEVRRAAQDARKAYQQLRTSGKATKAAKATKTTKAAKTAVTPVGKTAHTSVKTVKATGKTIKTASRATIKTATTTGKAVKTSAGTAKIATKSTVTATKGAAKATVAAAKVAKLSLIKAKMAAIKAKLVVKAVIATVKLAIAAVKALVALLMAGGWVAVAIILVVGLVGMFIASPFGIFFSGEESPDSERTMQTVVVELTEEFFEQIDQIAAEVEHDVLRVGGMTIRWNEVLAVYAVRVTTDSEDAMDVVTLDDQRVEHIRQVLHDMAELVYVVRTETEEQTVTDDEGNETIETLYITVLVITLEHRTAEEMAEYYGFDDDQREMLRELLAPEHMELWAMLLGYFAAGDGRVLMGNENFIPLGIFAWPLEGNWSITSRFGWRNDPFTGVRRFHDGIDIGAPNGTPILAMADGVVAFSGWAGGYGNFILIDHGSGYRTAYAHNSRNAVVVGQTVVQGQVIGYVGTTGSSTGYHLHFEIIRNGVPVDPLGYFTW